METSKTKIDIVQKLIDDGKLDGNPNLPKYPSMQLWVSLKPKEIKRLKEYVVGNGEDWDEYMAEIAKHHPLRVGTDKKYTRRINGRLMVA